MSREHDNTLDVWLNGRHAGTLLRADSGQVEFLYEADYQLDPESTPLSVSMPKTRAGHGPDRVMPWLSNLLPDSETVRDRWAAKFAERHNDPFTLLRHMGQDAPGSVQLVPSQAIPESTGTLSSISDTRIAQRIEGILSDPDHWVDDTDADQSRFSLGGNQGKFALAKIGDAWFEPNGRAASTHIVKPGMVTASGVTNAVVQAVEFVTMRSARQLGIPAATVEIHDFTGLLAFVTTRYDRHVHGDGTVTRIHQEDFCQAFSILPSRKYEEDGGPSMADMAGLVRAVCSPSYLSHDAAMLAKLFAFNLLIAGVDAHAKNHSLLLSGSIVRMAPAYDLISAHGIWEASRVKYKAGAAVKYGKARRFRSITGRNLVRSADVLGVNRDDFIEQLRELATALPEVFESVIAELPNEFAVDNLLSLPERLKTFAGDIVGGIQKSDVSDTPKFEPPAPRVPEITEGKMWVPGRWEADSWKTGHYRSRTDSRQS